MISTRSVVVSFQPNAEAESYWGHLCKSLQLQGALVFKHELLDGPALCC